jgi:hypothetical protein
MIGIFTRKATVKPRKIQSSSVRETGACWSALKVKLIVVPWSLAAITPTAIAAASIRNEPTAV